MAQVLQKRTWGRIAIATSFVANMLSIGSLSVVGIYMTSLFEEFNVGSAVLGWVCSMAPSVMCLIGPFASLIVDKFGSRWAVMAGGTVQATGMILSYYMKSLTGLFISQGISGIGASLICTSVPATIAFYFTKHYSTAMGAVSSGIGVGIIICPPLIAELIATYGWRGASLIQGAALFNIVVIGALLRPMSTTTKVNKKITDNQVVTPRISKKQKKPDDFEYCQVEFEEKSDNAANNTATKTPDSSPKWYPSHLNLLVNTPAIIFVFITRFCISVAYSAVLTHASNQIVSDGLSEKKGSLALSVLGIGSLFGRFCNGFIVDTKLLTPATLYELALLLAAGATFLNPIINSYIGCLISAICLGIATGIIYSLVYTIMRQIVGKSQIATATGLELLTGGFGTMTGGYLAGAVRDMTGDYSTGYYIFGATIIIGACFHLPIIFKRTENNTYDCNNTERETTV